MKKTIKAWVATATFENSLGKIRSDIFGFSGTDMAGIARTKEELTRLYSKEFTILPCTITYQI